MSQEARSDTFWYLRMGIAAAVIAAVAGFVVVRITAQMNETAIEELAPVEFTAAAERGSGNYPNGTYKTIGIYAPHGADTELEVTVTLENDAIVASEIKLLSQNKISIDITKGFEEGYKEFVIGKPIQGLNVGKVARSSLTPEGYNMALRQVEAYAKTL